jgi:hypothetical protein
MLYALVLLLPHAVVADTPAPTLLLLLLPLHSLRCERE